MKVLFVTSSHQDNLQDAYLHGLRLMFGDQLIDYPKKDVMYKGFQMRDDNSYYGRMFTLWRILDDISVDRSNIVKRVKENYFDLVVFGSIRHTEFFLKYFDQWLDPKKVILMDGDDDNRVLPWARKYLYFKRELTNVATYYYTRKIVPKKLTGKIQYHPNVLPVTFAIPEEKIAKGIARKDKSRMFPPHIVDSELVQHPEFRKYVKEGPQETPVFTEEADYYQSLKESQFGITVKRAGWDCLRHYEIAANGAVMCFRALSTKPPHCAPLGIDDSNAVIYDSADELLRTVENMKDDKYERYLQGGYRWVQTQTTENKAKDLLDRAMEQWRK